MAVVRSVNVGEPREASWANLGRTSIDKRPVTGPVPCGRLGLTGDLVTDTRHHGGPDQAVYAFAREELDWWAEQVGLESGQELRDGEFGENLTVEGLLGGSHRLDDAELGERWRVGTVLLEVRSVRTPCNDFKAWMGRGGFDNRAWVRRFAEHGRAGAYLRVLQEGELSAGDEVEVLDRPGHGVTVSTLFAAILTSPELLPRLLDVPDLVPQARRRAEAYVAGRGAGSTPAADVI